MSLRRLVALALLGLVPLVAGACFDDVAVAPDGPRVTDDGEDPGSPGTTGTEAPRLPGLFVRDLRSPLRLAAAPDALLLTDSQQRMVIQVDPTTLAYGRGIQIDGKPLGVAYLDHYVLVGNATKRTVQVYDGLGGDLVSDFGRGAVGHPSDIAVDQEEGLVFVLDGSAKAVKIFDRSGRRVGTVSGPGGSSEHLANPIGVAVDPARGEVLVSDYGSFGSGGSASVKIFGYDGTLRAEISGGGPCDGSGCADGFSRPQGLAVGQDGRIYVADALLATVLVFDRGTLAAAGRIGDRSFIRLPTDVVVGAEGDLFIVGNMSRNIRVVRRGAAP